jgi:DNA-binding FadR family transcriptional regulator
MMDAVRDVMRRALSSIYSIPGSPERSTEQHRRIFKAISAGEPDEARKQMREHLLRVEGEIRDVLRVRADEAIAAPTTEASSPLEARTEARA